MTAPLPAIVLTCQKHVPIAEHMIEVYGRLWPGHPLRFRLPDGSAARPMAARHPGLVELVPTDEGEGRGRFRAAVLGLLAGLDDDAWVWWCIDDKYPLWIDVPAARAAIDAAVRQAGPEVCGLSIVKARSLAALHDPEPLALGGLRWLRRRDYRQVWLHQLLRVKVLRTLFGGFPEVIAAAKQMDDLHRQAALPDDQQLYAISRNALVLGESTSGGRLLKGCAAGLQRGRGIPVGFEIDDRDVVIGRRPGLLPRLQAAVGLADW